MTAQHSSSSETADIEQAVAGLYAEVLGYWNARNASGFAACFASQGSMVGFDGTAMNGVSDITAHLQQVFTHHQTAAYVGKVREVRRLGSDVALLRAVAGMVPPGQTRLNPAVNTVHGLIAAREDARWRIELLQSTPAAYHGRPEASAALTAELQEAFDEVPR